MLVVVAVRATVTVVSSASAVLVQPTPPVLVVLGVMEARAVSSPTASTVNRLSTSTSGALLVVISVGTSITVVGIVGSVLVVSAPSVLMILGVVVTRSVSSPGTSAVNGLSTTRGGAGLVVVGVGAARSAVSSVCGHLVLPAPLVLVVRGVMVARSIRTPRPNTVHRLRATRGDTLALSFTVWTALSVAGSIGGVLVLSALLVLLTGWIMKADSIRRPLSLTVNRLTATTLGAVPQVVSMWASKAIVFGPLSNGVHTAALVLVILVVIGTRTVGTPGSNAIHRLRAAGGGALLIVVGVSTSITVVGSVGGVLVVSAPSILVVTVMLTRSVSSPGTGAVQRLGAARSGALLVVVAVCATLSIVSSVCGHLVVSAPLVLVVRGVMVAGCVRTPRTNTVHRLRAARGGARLVVVAVRASVTVVGRVPSHLVQPAPLVTGRGEQGSPVLNILTTTPRAIIHLFKRWVTTTSASADLSAAASVWGSRARTRPVSGPVTQTVDRLSAAASCALVVATVVGTPTASMSSVSGNNVLPAPLVLVVAVVMVAGPIAAKCSNTAHRLAAPERRAKLLIVRMRAAVTVVSWTLAYLVVPAPLVAGTCRRT